MMMSACLCPQLGRVGVFGGSKDYTGAPFFASISSLRMGADLAYVMTAQEAAPALKAYSPELMVRTACSKEPKSNIRFLLLFYPLERLIASRQQ